MVMVSSAQCKSHKSAADRTKLELINENQLMIDQTLMSRHRSTLRTTTTTTKKNNTSLRQKQPDNFSLEMLAQDL